MTINTILVPQGRKHLSFNSAADMCLFQPTMSTSSSTEQKKMTSPTWKRQVWSNFMMQSSSAKSPLASRIRRILQRALLIFVLKAVLAVCNRLELAAGSYTTPPWQSPSGVSLRCARGSIGILKSSVKAVFDAWKVTDIGRITMNPFIGFPTLFLFSILTYRRYEHWLRQQKRNNYQSRLRKWARKAFLASDGEFFDSLAGAFSGGLQRCSLLWYRYTLSCLLAILFTKITCHPMRWGQSQMPESLHSNLAGGDHNTVYRPYALVIENYSTLSGFRCSRCIFEAKLHNSNICGRKLLYMLKNERRVIIHTPRKRRLSGKAADSGFTRF